MSDQIIGENHDNISSAGRQKTILLDDTMLGRGGQRVYDCTYGGGAPSRGCEVYVTRIPRDCFEAELLPVFSRVGPIFEHRLMMEQNGLNRGYAYIKFTNPQVNILNELSQSKSKSKVQIQSQKSKVKRTWTWSDSILLYHPPTHHPPTQTFLSNQTCNWAQIFTKLKSDTLIKSKNLKFIFKILFWIVTKSSPTQV